MGRGGNTARSIEICIAASRALGWRPPAILSRHGSTNTPTCTARFGLPSEVAHEKKPGSPEEEESPASRHGSFTRNPVFSTRLVIEPDRHAAVERIRGVGVLADVAARIVPGRVERLTHVHRAELDLVPHVVELELDADAAAPADVDR